MVAGNRVDDRAWRWVSEPRACNCCNKQYCTCVYLALQAKRLGRPELEDSDYIYYILTKIDNYWFLLIRQYIFNMVDF